ncbi:MAG: DUF3592 domain-containing protein [Candidatus Thermoplasmatota archaeon]|nr:DUF3592 domain-containing protein [Candidatus Thermoplasmatota archaeon]
MTSSDASTPFWDSVDAPEQVAPLESGPAPPSEAAPEAVSLGILPAAPVATNTESDAERTPSVELTEEAFDQEEDEAGATMIGVFFLLFFSVFWIGGTAVATVVITGDLVEQHRTRHWEETPGTMEWSAVDTVTNCDDEGCSDEYCVEVAYTYGPEGQMSGDQLSTMEDCYETRRLAEKLVERYPAGADVTVYHHPENINETVLETGLALRYMWLLAFMLPFQGVSLVLLFLLQAAARSALFGSGGGGGSS